MTSLCGLSCAPSTFDIVYWASSFGLVFCALSSLLPHPLPSHSRPQVWMLSHENRPAMVQPPPTPAASDPLPPNGAPNGIAARHHLFIVTGPAGCGKSTVGQFIAKTMRLPFIEGDEVREPNPLLPTPPSTRNLQPTKIPTVPSPRQRREDVPRHSPDRRRPLGLAHAAA